MADHKCIKDRDSTAKLWTAIKASRSKNAEDSAAGLKNLLTLAFCNNDGIAAAARAALMRDHNIEAGPVAVPQPKARPDGAAAAVVRLLPRKRVESVAAIALSWAVAIGFLMMTGEDIIWNLLPGALT